MRIDPTIEVDTILWYILH